MYTIMIVDDEPLFADGLAECLRELHDPELEVFKAYHAREALQRLERTPMDILLLDIRMPGMTGLELNKDVQARWPRTKVLFLTGHDEFVYVQEALRQGSQEYILKTEGDEVIVEALRKTVKQIEEELREEQWASEARKQLYQARSSLRRMLLFDTATGAIEDTNSLLEQFAELEIPLRADRPVLLALGKVDEWTSRFLATDRSLYLFAVQNISQDLFEPAAHTASVGIDRDHVVWFIQPKVDEEYGERAIYAAEGILGQIQEKCMTLLQLGISMAMGSRFVSFGEADTQYYRLKNLMFRQFGLQPRLFLTDRQPIESRPEAAVLPHKKLAKLKSALDRNDKSMFEETVDELENRLGAGEENVWERTYVYVELVALATHTIQQLGLMKEAEERFELSVLFAGIQVPWPRFMDIFRMLMAFAFESRSREWERQGMDVVQLIKTFVSGNLHADLSLTKLAEHVNYHPAYLSRLYKQLSGGNLSDDIALMRLERARELLLDRQLKIHEVGHRIGFDSPRYFTKFFKSHTGLTPQEFRDRSIG
ncbi:response regulator [Paenibacillus sp. J5C_2022]|uniref:response regulator n=1 Tax=Paenibacillus sp. J5C2022 TaxID=2977129 RepID=UPI0021CFA010|nr:response regulator [Paenibacillus sp. J5C2022]MCU6708066.1 response regulator [Paenibacillus sp. J5C2022]